MPRPYDWAEDVRSSRARRRDDRIRWALLLLALVVFAVAAVIAVTGSA